jgi:hypothetical protein
MLLLARIVRTVTTVVVAIIVVGILLYVLGANRANDIVSGALDASRWLVGPFDNLFSLDSAKWQVVVNWGIAAVVYSFVGSLIARLLAGAGAERRGWGPGRFSRRRPVA